MTDSLSTKSERDLARLWAMVHPPFIHEFGHIFPLARPQPAKEEDEERDA